MPGSRDGAPTRPIAGATVGVPDDAAADATRTSDPAQTAQPALRPEPRRPRPRDPGRYHIIGEHGRGGLGRVSRAHDHDLGRDIAIKEILARDQVSELRFLREALITARLQHPGIVPVYEAGRWPDGTPFYAMKLVAGSSLRELIDARDTVDDRIALLHHVIAVADAIAYAHGRNIIHRDLKPSNVIVGDFGETVVIDWGLAKDLTASEETPRHTGPVVVSPHDDLTNAGSVLGTPAYMSPEQGRGEQVDQRADVFAIGAMLWQLCSVVKPPPAERQVRRQLLRRAGIDGDLITIIDKALEPDRARRYPHAGALAADLKAFKSGARIAARSYSLLALLVHWTRRHRPLAISVAVAVAVALAGGLTYVHRVARERDRADASEATAENARAASDAALAALTLKHAENLLATDPSSAIDVLASYQGTDHNREDQIRAEAVGHGVASMRAVPHTGNILRTAWADDGAVISLSADGTIVRTTPDGRSAVLARDVARIAQSAYAAPRQLLAYACNPANLCLFDVARRIRLASAPALQDLHAVGVAFSPRGGLLAVMSQDAILRIFDVVVPDRPALVLRKPIPGGIDVLFLDDATAVAGTVAGVELVRLDGTREPVSVPDGAHWDASAALHELALSTLHGDAIVLSAFPARITAHKPLCHGPVAGLRFIAGQPRLAYACREGTIGIWDLAHDEVTPRARFAGHADAIAVSDAGDYVIAAGDKGAIEVIDLETELVASYIGHGFRLTALTPPSAAHRAVISADGHGAIRTWPLPARSARVIATATTQFHAAVFDDSSETVAATTWLSVLTVFSRAAGTTTVGPHEGYSPSLERAPSGHAFAAYGNNGQIELWSFAPLARVRVIETGQGSIAQLRFAADSDDMLTAGRDGRLMRWSAAGAGVVLHRADAPIEQLAIAPATDATVFSTADGALWRLDPDGQAHRLGTPRARVTAMRVLPDRSTIYVGFDDGALAAIDTRSWRQQSVLRASGSVREIAAARDGHTVAIATNDGIVHVGAWSAVDPIASPFAWTRLTVAARHLALTPDGLLVIAAGDGLVWLYSPLRQRWVCLPTGAADLGPLAVTGDGRLAVAPDAEGRLIWIDLEAARGSLDTQ